MNKIKLKNYNSLDVILTLKRRWQLFCITLIASIVVAMPFVHYHLEHINAQIIAQNKRNAETLSQIEAERAGRFALRRVFLQVYKYENLALPDSVIINILRNDNRLIDSYKKYFAHSNFDIWEIKLREFGDLINDFAESSAESNAESTKIAPDSANLSISAPLSNIANLINANPIATNLQADAKLLAKTSKNKSPFLQRIIDNGFARLMEADENALLGKEAALRSIPVNRHYIHLDKHRIAFEKGYTLTSAQIISANIQTHGKKIYIFAAFACVGVSLFIVFFVDCAINIRQKIRADSAK